MSINGHVSDLFFNLNTDDIERPRDSKGTFAGYDQGKLLDKADWFLTSMAGAGCAALPTAAELVDDFKGRV